MDEPGDTLGLPMQDDSQTTPRYRVNGLNVDLGTCEVTFKDKAIALPKLSFDLFASLIRNAPNVVTIDRLIDEVWSGRIVAEETVTQRVKLLRDALSAAGYGKELVATVRGRGYRLAWPVERVDNTEATQSRRSRRLGAAAIVSVALAAGGMIALTMLENAAPPLNDNSIAVLPFVDFSADNNVGYVGDGIAEELLNRFAGIPGLHVTSRTSSFAFRDPTDDIRSIAAQLGVRTVLEGSVREFDGQLRITVQLIDAMSDRHIWSQTFDRELTDVLNIQDDVATAVLDRFRLSSPAILTSDEVQLGPDAVDSYLRGRHMLRKRTAASLESAIELFERVIEIQPNYAPAHAALAAAYIDFSRRGNLSIDEAERQASRAVNQALEIDSELAEAHSTLGLLRLSAGDTEGAEAALRHAIKLNPNLADASLLLGYTLNATHRPDEAMTMFERTLALDPMNVSALDALAFGLMADGDYDAVIRQFQRRLRIENRNGESYRLMAMTARTFGRLEQAVLWAREAVAADPEGPLNINELVMAYSAIGELDIASELARRSYEQAPDNHWVALLRAFTFINSGDFAALSTFAEDQLLLVDPAENAILSQADRMRLAIVGLASFYAGDFISAEHYFTRTLGEPLTSVLEIQFTIGLMGALAYSHEQNGNPQKFEQTLHTLEELVADQTGWVNQHLVYADSIAAVQLMRGDRDAAIATIRQAIADGWTGHRGFLYGPLWSDFYASDDEFRSIMDELRSRIDSMKRKIRRANPIEVTAGL